MMKERVASILLTLLTVSICICGSAGASSISVEGGAVTAYAVGDIILTDGSSVKAADFTAVDDGKSPVAVIAGFKADGVPFGVGVHRSALPLQWAADDTVGYATKFSDTVSRQDSATVFTGDTDGSDNWEIIRSIDAQGTANATENYPAFDFANAYAETFGLTGDYASGWYMPSIAELYILYENRKAVNSSLKIIYAMDNNAAMDGLDTNWYWSSSQADCADDYAWFVHYFNGYAGECPKNFTNVHTLAVRAF